jgi:hypothetical protein
VKLLIALCIVLVAVGARTQALPDAPMPQPDSLPRPRPPLRAFPPPHGDDLLPAHVAVSRRPPLWPLFAVGALDAAAATFDFRETLIGLRHGVAVEGNNWLIGTHPSAAQLSGRETLVIGLLVSPALIAYHFRSKPFFYASLVAPVVMAAKHIQAGNRWVDLLAGHPPQGCELGSTC